MDSYRISWKPSALRELKKLPRNMISRIVHAVEALAINPYPLGSKKLVGSQRTYRIREGDYRVVYDVMTEQILIEVVRVGHRRDVYR